MKIENIINDIRFLISKDVKEKKIIELIAIAHNNISEEEIRDIYKDIMENEYKESE